MPATNPRLTITLEPSLAAQLRRLSELTGNSQSKIIAEVLEGSTEVFERIVKVLEAAVTAKDQLKGTAVEDMKHAQHRIETQLGLINDDWDRATGSLLKEAEAINRRARKGAPARPSSATVAEPTPLSNRGVRSLTLAKTSVKARAK